MSYDTVVALFGDPGEVQMEMDVGIPGMNTVNYQWGSGLQTVLITFQGGKVTSKMQVGLK